MSVTLCLDPGTAHTGIAISREGLLSDPLDTIFERDLDTLVARLTPYIARLSPETIVIGTPSSGPLVKTAVELSEKLPKIFSGKIILFNEDLSSKEARSKMREAGKRHDVIKAKEHQTAAALILQDYLDTV